MTIEVFIFLIGFLICLLSLLLRIGYFLLPKDKAFINNTICKCDKKNNLLHISYLVEYIVNNKKKYKASTIVLKPKYFFKKDEYIFGIENLSGKFLDFYYLPGFKSYGYLDCQLLMTPLWVYMVFFIIMSFPVFVILIIK